MLGVQDRGECPAVLRQQVLDEQLDQRLVRSRGDGVGALNPPSADSDVLAGYEVERDSWFQPEKKEIVSEVLTSHDLGFGQPLDPPQNGPQEFSQARRF